MMLQLLKNKNDLLTPTTANSRKLGINLKINQNGYK